MVASVLCSLAQLRLTYHSHPEPVELQWVIASAGQGAFFNAVIHL